MIYISRVSAFLFCLRKETPAKKRQTRGFTPRPRNAAPQHIARGSHLVTRHIRPQTRRSLNECGLVRLASQAVPSPVSVRYQTLRRGYWRLDYKDKSAVHFYFVKIRANQINKSKFIKPINLARLYTLQKQKRPMSHRSFLYSTSTPPKIDGEIIHQTDRP